MHLMLIDDVTITLKAGNGGRGAAAFQRVKLMQGPTGADGGRGGCIYFEGVSDVTVLQQFASRREIKAPDGGNGRAQFIDGKGAEDLILKVPVGTRITNTESGFVQEIVHVGDRLLAVGGGKGGRGNFKFRGPSNTSPMEFEEGTMGDVATFHLELRLIADVGLVGLPNAGKSSLLNELTRAKSKVGSYAFTTLEPHLGSHYGIIIADIPGLIEGASQGKGLGDKFLRHIQHTSTLFHLVSAESEDPLADYKTVRAELEAYDPELMHKTEHVLLTKSDMVDAKRLKEIVAVFKKKKIAVLPVSILDDASMAEVKKLLNSIQK